MRSRTHEPSEQPNRRTNGQKRIVINRPQSVDTEPPHRARVIVMARWLVAIRWIAGIVFVVFGAGKFVNHASELASFRHYALPAPGVFVYVIGALEVAGGLALPSSRLVRITALVLATDMVGAIIVSGIGQGEIISLTLAPALLVAMIFVLCAGAAIDPRRVSSSGRPSGAVGA